MMRSRAFIALGNFFFHVRNGLFPLLVPLAFRVRQQAGMVRA